MPELALNLLGSSTVMVDGKPIRGFATAKTSGLLFYLALEAGASTGVGVPRRMLAGLLWPEIGERSALQNLRNTLYYLRQTLDKAAPGLAARILTVTRQEIGFNGDQATIDALEFQRLLDEARYHRHEDLAECDACIERLESALALYGGELLAGFSVVDATGFEEWLLLRREMVHGQAVVAASALAAAYEQRHALAEAKRTALQLLHMDPFREESHRQLMRIYARQGEPQHALSQYQTLRQLFQVEFNSEPSHETQELVRQIAEGRLGRTPEPSPQIVKSILGPDLRDVPMASPFFGREAEFAQLEAWLVHERCRLVAILGIGGMGKTSLAAHAVRTLAHHFDMVVWRSLLNAPPLADLLPNLLRTFSIPQSGNIPDSLDEQIRMFRTSLQEQRILLVFDNVESILDGRRVGAYRAGYEPYGQLIEQVAIHEHQSHLLLTSRERPHRLARLEGDSERVRALQLAGLDDAAGQALLAQRGVPAATENSYALIQRYSGNPLALKLVADAVADLFGGDISSFLTDESLVFDDIRTVLDGQFSRISLLEQEILYWLAVEREATPAASLRANLLHPPTLRVFIESLRNLQRRSLIELRETGFALQNVITEYLSDRLMETVYQEIATGEIQLLHTVALQKAQAKAYVRESQARLLFEPILAQLADRYAPDGAIAQLTEVLQSAHEELRRSPSYFGGNMLNLLLHEGADVTGYDFSQLSVWQAYLQGASLSRVNFREANFSSSVFTRVLSEIYSVAIDRHDRWLASAGGDGDIQIWTLATGELSHTLKGHTNRCNYVVFSPDGTLLASAGMDCSVRLWDVGSGRCLRVLHGHTDAIRQISFSFDGQLLASGGQDSLIKLWDVATGTCLYTIEHHHGWVNAIAFHPTENLLASCSSDNTICLWDVQTVQQADGADPDPAPENAIQIKSVRLRRTLQGHDRKPVCLAYSPDGSILASGSADQTICLWETATGECLRTLRGHTHWIRALAFSPDGSILASGSADRTVRLWEVDTGRCINGLKGHAHVVWSVAFSTDGRTLASGGEDHAIHLWDLCDLSQSRSVSTIQGNISRINAVAYRPDGRALATAGSKGWVWLWQVNSATNIGQRMHLLTDHAQQILELAFSPDGSCLATGGGDKVVRLWDIESGACIAQLHGHTKAIHCVRFDPTGNLLATAGDEGVIYLWDVQDPRRAQRSATLRGHAHVIESLAFSPDGSHIASCGGGRLIHIWRLHTARAAHSGESVQVVDGCTTDSWSVAFHPDGGLLASAGADGAIRLWEIRDDLPAWLANTLTGHTGIVRSVAFNAQGTQLASGGEDSRVCLWDAATGQLLHMMDDHTQSVLSVAFHPSGKTLISGGSNGTVRLWDATTGESLQVLPMPGPYDGMDITGATGISETQKAALKVLGAIEDA